MEKSRISRRGMLKGAAAAVLALDGSVSAVSSAATVEQLPLVQKTPVIGSKNVTGQKVEGSVAKVYFSPVIDAASLIKLYNLVNEEIYGKVAIKLHTGEPHGPNILPRDMVQALQKTIPNSTIVETNTLYGGGRENTADHRKTLEINGWSFCPVDIMDEHGDVNLPVRDGEPLLNSGNGAMQPVQKRKASFSFGFDLMSSYVCRGAYQTGASIQPKIA